MFFAIYRGCLIYVSLFMYLSFNLIDVDTKNTTTVSSIMQYNVINISAGIVFLIYQLNFTDDMHRKKLQLKWLSPCIILLKFGRGLFLNRQSDIIKFMPYSNMTAEIISEQFSSLGFSLVNVNLTRIDFINGVQIIILTFYCPQSLSDILGKYFILRCNFNRVSI